MALFKKIAPPEEYEKLNSVINGRIEEAEAQMELAQTEKMAELTKSVDAAIESFSIQIEDTTKRLYDARRSYDKVQYELNQAIQNRKNLAERQKKYEHRTAALENLPVLGIIGTVIFGILGLMDGTQFFMVLVVCGLLGAVAWGVLYIVGLIITAILPGKNLHKELNDATQRENTINTSANSQKVVISNLEADLKQCENIRSYMEHNKEFILSTLSAVGSNDVLAFVKKQLETT